MQPYRVWLLTELIEKNRRQFRIPVYQRHYDWSKEECEKLYTDLSDAYKEDKQHFTGTIVYLKGKPEPGQVSEDLIIDGQQRITTMFLMLKALYDIAIETGNESVVPEVKDFMYNRNCGDEYRLKLKSIREDDEQFRKLMREDCDFDSLDSNSNLVRNYYLFRKLINRSLKETGSLRDILYGMKKLYVVEIILDESQGDDPQTIFESINSTGVELSLSDLIRNFILMNDREQERLFSDYWMYIEKKLGKERLTGFFVRYLEYRISDPVKPGNAYEKFKTYYRRKGYTHESMLKDLKKHADYYSLFAGLENDYSKELNNLFDDFGAMEYTSVYPFFFGVMNDFNDGIIDEKTLIDILVFIRNYCVKRIVCEVSSGTQKGLFKSLYRKLFKNDKDNYYERIYSYFMNLNTKDHPVSDQLFKERLMHSPLYSKRKICKLIMGILCGSEGREAASLVIEHIMPKTPDSAIWKKEMGDEYKRVYDRYLHTLGNLTVTGYSGNLGSRPFKDKQEIIRKNSDSDILNNSILEAESWSKKEIIKRADSLSDIVIKRLGYREVEQVFDIQDSDNDRILTLDSTDRVAGTKPVSFTFAGEKVPVSNYIQLLFRTSELLYSMDNRILETMAKKESGISDTSRVYVTYNQEHLRRGRPVGDSGIFLETNLSSKDILKFIKRLIDKYAMDPDGYTFEIR